MCWISNKLKIKTAKRNIPIWKVVEFDNKRKIYISPFKYYQYFPGTINTTQMIFRVFSYSYEINGYEGFHSFSNKLRYKYSKGDISVYKKGSFAKEKYFFTYDADCNFSPAIAKGYLPKGTKYAINKVGEVISDCIVINEFIDL